MRDDADLAEGLRRSSKVGDSVSLPVHFPELAFDSPALFGGVHLDLQGACVRFNARFACSASASFLFLNECLALKSAENREVYMRVMVVGS